MKKKLVLKKGIQKILILISILSIIVLAGESDSLQVFITSKLVALTILLVNQYLLSKYSDLYRD